MCRYSILRAEVHYDGSASRVNTSLGFSSPKPVASRLRSSYTAVNSPARRHFPRIPVSPLLQVRFWRVVVDEAQMVGSTTAQSSAMAARIAAVHRWCVTGTPIGKNGVADLHGLFIFLHHATYDGGCVCVTVLARVGRRIVTYTRGCASCDRRFMHKLWWRQSMQQWLREPGIPRVINVLRPLFWRRSKAEVSDQICLPPLRWERHDVMLGRAEQEILTRLKQQLLPKVRQARAMLAARKYDQKATSRLEAMLHQLRLVRMASCWELEHIRRSPTNANTTL